ncbi:hypothetical protein KJ633_03630 [bacterium]|nr:hypothetical protein [bacterium]MBU3955529.1 hypothetical protein [bacterium]
MPFLKVIFRIIGFVVMLITSVPIFATEPRAGLPGEEIHVTLFIKGVTDIVSPFAGFTYEKDDSFFLKLPEKEGLELINLKITKADGEISEITLPLMIKKISSKLFIYTPEATTEKVSVAGSFNGWNANSDIMEKTSSGKFEILMTVPPGIHSYKLVIDGKWITDPANPEKSADGFGGFNSILSIKEKKVKTPFQKRESLEGGKWKLVFSYFDDAFKGYKVILYYRGEVREKVYDGTSVSFSLPEGEGLETVYLWASDRDGNFSPMCIIPKNFSEEPSWPQTVIYSLMTDRFYNGDKSNDNPVVMDGLSPKANYMGGDFAGIKQKIEDGYFARLGVNCIWISPVIDNVGGAFKDALPPHRYFTGYHGYWPASFVKTEERFGSAADLKAMIKTAHAHGIKVIDDMVFNHVHTEHPWYGEHPEWFGKLELPNGEKNIRKFDEYPFTTWFDSFLPSFDYSNGKAVEAVVKNALWWIEEFGFDGARLDAVKHIPYNFWKAFAGATKETFGSKFYMVGESIASRKDINSFVSAEMLDGQFDFPLYWPIRDVFALGKENYKMLSEQLGDSLENYKNVYYMSPLLGNHDFPRFMAYADGDITGDEKKIGWENPPRVDNPESYGKIKNAFTFLLTNPGIPMIYYGDEIAMTGAADPDNRRMMMFDNTGKNEKDVFDHVSKLLHSRAKSPAVTMGRHDDLLTEDKLWAYIKHYFQDSVIVVFNAHKQKRKLVLKLPEYVPAGGFYKSIFTGRKYKIKKGQVVIKTEAASSDVFCFSQSD